MADVYVASTGSNTSPYETWAKAATTLATATGYASAGDTIYAHQETETITGASVTYTLAAGVKVIGSNDTGNAPPQTAGTRTQDGSATGGLDIVLAGTGSFERIDFKCGATLTATMTVAAGASDTAIAFDTCKLYVNSTGASTLTLGFTSASYNQGVRLHNCTVYFGHASSNVVVNCPCESTGTTWSAGATHPTTLFVSTASLRMNATFEGDDFSNISGSLFGVGQGHFKAVMSRCKVHASVTPLVATGTRYDGELWMFDCDSGDTHYKLRHYDPLGSTTVSTSIYVTADGATYDGTNRLSWLVTSTSLATYGQPYCSPWIDAYNEATSAVTPYLESLRNANATPYTDTEVWSQWSAKVTAGSARATLSDDSGEIVSAAGAAGTAQTASALGAGDWTGEHATLYAFMKLGPGASLTPAEIGDVRFRVVVGKASISDLYVDPKIRGL
jgi:hypothetical protein